MSDPNRDTELDYLCVEQFLASCVDARVLKTAFELGLVDCLHGQEGATRLSLAAVVHDEQALQLLLGLLQANHVIETHTGQVRLTNAFRHALVYRDLLEAKLDFANLVAPDFLESFTDLLINPARFRRSARVFA